MPTMEPRIRSSTSAGVGGILAKGDDRRWRVRTVGDPNPRAGCPCHFSGGAAANVRNTNIGLGLGTAGSAGGQVRHVEIAGLRRAIRIIRRAGHAPDAGDGALVELSGRRRGRRFPEAGRPRVSCGGEKEVRAYGAKRAGRPFSGSMNSMPATTPVSSRRMTVSFLSSRG